MTNTEPPQQTAELPIEQALQQGIAHHQAGEFEEAGQVYLGILQTHPNHPEVNTHMGILAVQMQQPAAALSYFTAALDANPTRGQYWLNYIDALFQAGQLEDALQMLVLARQQGLQGDEVEALAQRLKGATQIAVQPNATHQLTPAESLPVASASPQKNQKTARTNPAGKSGPRKGPTPSPQEINALVALFAKGRLAEAATIAQTMTERFPRHEFGWKALGAVFKRMGRSADALLPMQKAAALSPDDVEAHYNLGVTLQDLGRLDEAKASYRQALQIDSTYAQAHSNLGVILQSQGQLDEAEMCLRQALKIKPDNAEALSNLGVILQKLDRQDESETCFRHALQIKPDNTAAHSNLGITLQAMGRSDEAEACYRKALQIDPNYADAHFNLGNILRELDRLEEAESSYQSALKIKPGYAEAHFNLGNTLTGLKRFTEAEASFKRALEINPNYAEAHFNLGNILSGMARLEEAEASYKRALAINPEYAEANYNLGIALFRLCRLPEAGVYYWRALKIKPDYAEVYCSLAELLLAWNRLDEAEESLQKALEIDPDCGTAHIILGTTLTKLGRLAEAEASCRRALEINPQDAVAHCNLGNALYERGQLKQAEVSYRQALEHHPTYNDAHSNLLFCLLHNATVDTEARVSEHHKFGERYEASHRNNWPSHANSREPERALQIGFVSNDLMNHAVASFIEPVLVHLAGYRQLTLHAYANHIIDDPVSLRLRGYFAHWHLIAPLSDDALVEKIRADGIDILIDLSGHTARNRLPTFARKPAPVQVSWMGYPGTTGLSAMDYYLADRFFLPPGQFDGEFTEKIVRLPASAPFLPFESAPPVNTLPALQNGFVTFGSFNRMNKLNRSSIALWSQLLRALPQSRMLLAGMPQDGKYDTLIEWFAQEGIERQRLDFHPRSNMNTYLALHHQVDICLDTFPYNGATTSLHALWMGVPTLTLVGDTMPGRAGATILSHVGLEECIAKDVAEFVQKGIALVSDLTALSQLRAGLRERFTQSAPGRPEIIAAGLERALRTMWRRWCADLSAESFEVSLQDIDAVAQETGK